MMKTKKKKRERKSQKVKGKFLKGGLCFWDWYSFRWHVSKQKVLTFIEWPGVYRRTILSWFLPKKSYVNFIKETDT